MSARVATGLLSAAACALAAGACLELAPVEPASSGGASGALAGGSGGGAGASGGSSGSVGTPSGGTGGMGAGGAGGTPAGGGGTGVGGSMAFSVRGVVFDGWTDWLSIESPFVNVADQKSVTGSLWLRRLGLGSTQCLGPEALGSGSPNQLQFADTDEFQVVWRRAGGGVACALASAPITDQASWHHVMFSVDVTDANRRHLYVDGSPSMSVLFWANEPLDLTGSQWGLFADNGGGAKYHGEAAELWLAFGVYIDLSDPANRAKFRSVAGKPADLGPSGALPTGSPASIYLSLRPGEQPHQFAQNRGTAGGFVVHGALAEASTSPSD